MVTNEMTLVGKFLGRVVRVESGRLKEINTMDRFNPFTTFEAK